MAGTNCSIFGCSRSRRKPGLAIFKVPQGDHEWISNWRKSFKKGCLYSCFPY